MIWPGRIVELPPDTRSPYLHQLETVGRLGTELYLQRLDSTLTKTQRDNLQDKIKLANVEYEALLSYLTDDRG